ncbi:hypothetical protein ACT3CE_03380 [Marinifilum sp. RC60d5]|uniref:hypothetical protein n=1 Tax=Marinifilum sp. RC60d5 TaxID=3458414 RepID=UPI004035BAF9
MDSRKDNRKYGAYLARQFYNGKKPIRLIEDEFPYSETDSDLKELFRLIKNTPKRKGLFKASKEKYENYIINVYQLIEDLESDLKQEIIKEVLINDKNELLLKISGNGNPTYQYVYREAAGVYWDDNEKGFKSTPIKEWTASKWFLQISSIVKSCLGVDLVIDEKTRWNKISDTAINEIKNAYNKKHSAFGN